MDQRLVDVKSFSPAAWKAWVDTLGEPAYRARQIMRWVYRAGARDFDEMTDLPLDLRRRLRRTATLTRLEAAVCRRARDGTQKFLARLPDGETVECVLIPEGKRRTACISSQVGCGIGCTFCATALGGLKRNLRAGEIVDQLLLMQRITGERITHVVFMGMGEPLANLKEVLAAVELITHPSAIGLAQRRVTISTAGVVPGIYRLSEAGLQVGLAVSLHATTDEQRARLVPLAKRYPLAQLLQACEAYRDRTGRRVTFEYVLIRGENDSLDDAHRLAALASPLRAHINLIPLNSVPETGLVRSTSQAIRRFHRVLTRAGVRATVRRERGADIEAACGQLRRASGV